MVNYEIYFVANIEITMIQVSWNQKLYAFLAKFP